LLLAFTLQCYAIQTHIHGAPQAADGGPLVKGIEKSIDHGKSPAAPDTADCPICQAIAHTGAFFAPAAPLLVLPAWAGPVASPVTLRAIFRAAATHNWFSRAPPRL
jgi:hypothetical protein